MFTSIDPATGQPGETFAELTADAVEAKLTLAHPPIATGGPPSRTMTTPMGTATARWLPMGVVIAVMPWNLPYRQVVRFLAPTILAGHVGLLKHTSLMQGCGAAIEAMVLAAGAPPGLFQNLALKSDKVDALIADPRVVAVTWPGARTQV